jgi:hypothetical protein
MTLLCLTGPCEPGWFGSSGFFVAKEYNVEALSKSPEIMSKDSKNKNGGS